MKSQLITLLVVFTIWKNSSTAQSKLPDVIPPSPEAASLGKYAETPVSYNTGIPQIEIPLYEIAVNDIKLPINMSYHAGGIKVNEVASWVGLGWTLNAGGVITRVMRGRPDESTYGYFNKVQWDTWQDMKTWITGPPQLGVNNQASQKHNFQLAVANGEKDLQSDIFYFNFAGYTGRIVFDVDKNPVIIPFQDLKIEHPFSNEEGNRWVITTPEGIQFTFRNSDAEWTEPLNEGFNQSPFHSTWHLSEIRSLKQPGFVTFNYQNTFLMGIETSSLNGAIFGKANYSDTTCLMDPPYPVSMGTNTYNITTKYLDNIQFTNGSISFYSAADRLDKYQNNVDYDGRKLNSLVVFAQGYNHVKTITFNYSYRADRLMLDGLQETGKPPYRLEYNSLQLPPTNSFAQDHWGYYNEKHANLSLIPPRNNSEIVSHRPNNAEDMLANANRESTHHSIAATLKKITYPTGGERRYTLEPNIVNGDVETKLGTEVHAAGATLNGSMNSYEQGQYNYFISQQYQYLGGPINVRSTTFTLNQETDVHFSFSAKLSVPGEVGDIAQVYTYKIPIDYNDPVAYNVNGILSLEPGQYVMIAAASQSNLMVSGSVSYTVIEERNYLVGGLRISKIEDFDTGKRINTTIYNYNIPETNTTNPDNPPLLNDMYGQSNNNQVINVPKSSGVLFHVPIYKKITPCGRLYISASDMSPLVTTQGYHIGYDRVEVKKIGNVENEDGDVTETGNGSTVYRYNNSHNELLRNLVQEVVYLDEDRDTVKHIQYDYAGKNCFNNVQDCKFSSIAISISMEIKKRVVEQDFFFGQIVYEVLYNEFDIKQNAFRTFFVTTSRITEKTFSRENYPAFLVTTKTITTGNDTGEYETSHTLPTETIHTLENGDKIIERFTNSPEVYEGTLDIKVPVQHVVIRETNGQQYLVKTQASEYSDNLLVNVSAFEPAVPPIYSDQLNVELIEKEVFLYDQNQKLKEHWLASGLRKLYVWDIWKQQVISQIVSSTGGCVAFTGFENASNEGNWQFTLSEVMPGKTGAKAHIFQQQNIICNALNSPTQYTVSFWAKDGAPVVSNVIESNDATGTGSDGWMYYEKIISGTESITISAPPGTHIDELRLYPTGAKMVSYAHKPGVGPASITDVNNQTTYYEYDASGKLIFVRDANGKIVKHYSYHYRD